MSLQRQLDLIQGSFTKQYEAIEAGGVALAELGDNQGTSDTVEARRDQESAIPFHLFREESLGEFPGHHPGTGEDRGATKTYLKPFIEKIVINLSAA